MKLVDSIKMFELSFVLDIEIHRDRSHGMLGCLKSPTPIVSLKGLT